MDRIFESWFTFLCGLWQRFSGGPPNSGSPVQRREQGDQLSLTDVTMVTDDPLVEALQTESKWRAGEDPDEITVEEHFEVVELGKNNHLILDCLIQHGTME